jgi:hypothetical protein
MVAFPHLNALPFATLSHHIMLPLSATETWAKCSAYQILFWWGELIHRAGARAREVCAWQGMGAFSNKEKILPNQNMVWQMGIWHVCARKQPALAQPIKERRITEHYIGAALTPPKLEWLPPCKSCPHMHPCLQTFPPTPLLVHWPSLLQ